MAYHAAEAIYHGHTFFFWIGSWWKCGASTSVATFAKPSTDARPIRVMGDSRLVKRVRLRALPLAASSQMLFTNATGSIGSTVLKKTTTSAISLDAKVPCLSLPHVPHCTSNCTGVNNCTADGLRISATSAWISSSIVVDAPSAASGSSGSGSAAKAGPYSSSAYAVKRLRSSKMHFPSLPLLQVAQIPLSPG